jgi:hypothetical protein
MEALQWVPGRVLHSNTFATIRTEVSGEYHASLLDLYVRACHWLAQAVPTYPRHIFISTVPSEALFVYGEGGEKDEESPLFGLLVAAGMLTVAGQAPMAMTLGEMAQCFFLEVAEFMQVESYGEIDHGAEALACQLYGIFQLPTAYSPANLARAGAAVYQAFPNQLLG